MHWLYLITSEKANKIKFVVHKNILASWNPILWTKLSICFPSSMLYGLCSSLQTIDSVTFFFLYLWCKRTWRITSVQFQAFTDIWLKRGHFIVARYEGTNILFSFCNKSIHYSWCNVTNQNTKKWFFDILWHLLLALRNTGANEAVSLFWLFNNSFNTKQ